MLKFRVEVDEAQVKKLVLAYLQDELGLPIKQDDVVIEVKSKQNYKSEWERAEFRAVVDAVKTS